MNRAGKIKKTMGKSILIGALLAFLWHNIPPAKFYMTETGVMGLCATLTVIAFLTDSVLVLPIIGIQNEDEEWEVNRGIGEKEEIRGLEEEEQG